jgi:ankyrin repeat protein
VKQAKLPSNNSSKLMDQYKVLTAMLFGASHLVDDFWGSLLRDGALFNHENGTTPLVHAVATQDRALFDNIIKYCRTTSPNTANSAFEMQKAFGLALQRSRADLASDIASIPAPRIRSAFVFRQWLALAIPLRHMDLFELILPQYPDHVQSRLLDIALKFATFGMVTALFDVNKIMNMNNTHHSARRGESFIETACGAGNAEVIRGLIDAGAEVPDTALSFALKNNKWDAFIHLRNIGCPIPCIDRWSSNCSQHMYNELCAMKVDDGVEKSLLPSYDMFKGMSWQALRKFEASLDPLSRDQ